MKPKQLPKDYLKPQWDEATAIHDWKNYVSKEIQELWNTLSPEICAALARQADAHANKKCN